MFINIFSLLILITPVYADNHNVSELLETIQKDLKTLEKAVYSNSSGNDLNIPVKIKIENIKQRLNDSLIGIPYKKYKIEEVLVFIDDSKNDFTKFTDSINYKDFRIYSKGKLKFKPKSITSGINSPVFSISHSFLMIPMSPDRDRSTS